MSSTDNNTKSPDDSGTADVESVQSKQEPQKKLLGFNPIKLVFALEYVLQGIANPFQGMTYQPFFKHFRYDYKLSEAVTQGYFAKSYLAWSFKPVLGFFIDAYGKTKVILTSLLIIAIGFYLFTPFLDVSPQMFFGLMFALAIFLAATDVAVDRATVIQGDIESQTTGKSKSTTVGLNQAICWAAIYLTSIIAAISGGYIADHVDIDFLMYGLAFVPAALLMIVLFLPRDKAVPIPVKESVKNFWDGLNTGPVMWIIVFYFLFHFQPAMGALWTNHLIENLGFTQTEIGFSDGAAYIGLFLGVIIFATYGIRWQDRLGLKRLFRIFIFSSVAVQLTMYMMVEPYFSRVTAILSGLFPFVPEQYIRVGYLGAYNLVQNMFFGITRMSTLSLVGAVIPLKAAGSLFAGFMSVANLAYGFCYSSGAWLYENGLNYGILRFLQQTLFGIPAVQGTNMSINLLIFIGSVAYFLSFLAAHNLPDKKQTLAIQDDTEYLAGPEKYNILGKSLLKNMNIIAVILMAGSLYTCYFIWDFDPISSVLFSFFGMTFLRKVFLDWRYKVKKVNSRQL